VPDETEAAPIGYVAEMPGADTDSERAIRELITVLVLCWIRDCPDGRNVGTSGALAISLTVIL
jgi:hypothetical protein